MKTIKTGHLKVYTLTSTLIKQQKLAEVEINIPLSQGFYIITFDDGHQQKVVIE